MLPPRACRVNQSLGVERAEALSIGLAEPYSAKIFPGPSCRMISRISSLAIRFFCSSTFAIILMVAMFSVIIFAAALDAARISSSACADLAPRI